MKLEIKTFSVVCALMLATIVAPVMATDYNPGVSVGQYVKYGNYVVTTPAQSVTSPDWSKIEVVGVSGNEVTLRITGAYMNGTAIPTSQLTCNIKDGMTNGQQRYLIAANLNQGDKILNLQTADTINKTETRTILGTSRSVNILNFTSSYAGQNMKAVYIYDKESGMHLGMDMEITIIESAVTYTNSYTIIDTNIFDVEPIPEFQAWMVLPMFMAATTLALVIKKRKTPKQ